MKALLVCTLLLPALQGCATKIDLSNRVSRTEACDEVHVTSKWTKWFGFTTVVDERDAAVLLEKCRKALAK